MVFPACAKNPDKISAKYVSPLQYEHLDCEQIRLEIQRVNRRISEVSGVQRKERRQDSVATGVGIVLFWPTLFFLMGGDKKDDLARLKGEYEALQTVAIQKKCSFAAEMGVEEVEDVDETGQDETAESD